MTTSLKSAAPAPTPSKARDIRKRLLIATGVLLALALLLLILGLTRVADTASYSLLCVLAALPMGTLLVTGYADGHARRGVASTVFHIAMFAEIAVLCLVLGIYGNSLLKNRTAAQKIPARVEAYTDTANGIEASLQPIFTDVVGTEKKAQNTIKNKVFSNKRATVKTALQNELSEGVQDELALKNAVGIYVDKAADEFPEQADLLRQSVSDNTARIIEALISAADERSAAVTTSTVKDDLNPKDTENYALMYFGTALILIGAACAALTILLLVLWCTRDEEGRAHIGERLEPFDYLLPFLIGVIAFTLYPMIRVFIMSFQERYRVTSNGAGTFDQWGLGNYDFVINGNTSEAFLRGLKNTATYVLFTVPITAALAIVIAYLLNQKNKLRALFQTAYFLPMVTTATAVGLVWKWMFNGNSGLINLLITSVTQFFGAPEKIQWLMTGGTNHTIPMAVLIIYGIWNTLPFTIILLLSGLQNIDENLYTVAKVDGSSAARIFFKITVPLLSPTIGLVLIINSISAFKVYTEVFVLWSGSPENYQMETVTWYIYNNIITPTDGTHSLGYAAAAAMILFVIIFVFTMIQKFIQRKWVYQ